MSTLHQHQTTTATPEQFLAAWERLHYDWSDPTRIVITDTDSNVWGGRSAYVYTLTPDPTAAPTSTRS
jgi:hypothetical protein